MYSSHETDQGFGWLSIPPTPIFKEAALDLWQEDEEDKIDL